jgi:flagellar motor switch/type III secretory pathway protein FliN
MVHPADGFANHTASWLYSTQHARTRDDEQTCRFLGSTAVSGRGAAGPSTEATRLALASVMDQVGLHLGSPEIVMRPGFPRTRGPDNVSVTIVDGKKDDRKNDDIEMADVVTIRPRDLPRVSARDAMALTRAARLLAGLPRRIETTLGELGSIVLTVEGMDALGTAASDAAGDVVLGVARGGDVGRLLVDAALAQRVIARALGGDVRASGSLARLGLGERGVVAGIVASLLHGLGAPFSVSLFAPGAVAEVRDCAGQVARGKTGEDAGDASGGVAIRFAVTAAAVTGWARLEVPLSWLAAAGSLRAPEPALAALELELRVELARTSLAPVELAGVVAGDAVIFDGEPSLASSRARSVRVVVGPFAASGQLAEDGRVILKEAFQPAPAFVPGRRLLGNEAGSQDVTMEMHMQNETKHEMANLTAALAAAPIEIIAEVGRVTLRGEEVVGLGPGAVIALGRAGAAPVVLRVGGDVWAEGELCDVDGELGVRVTATRRSGFANRLVR